MLLAIDIGNTNTVIGIFDRDRLIGFYRLSSREMLTADEAGLELVNLCGINKIDASSMEGVSMCSVVPSLALTFESAVNKYFNLKPLVLTHETDHGLIIDYDIPNQVGADRIADAAAAFDKYGGPTIIVDLGTAITVDAVSSDSHYLGGAIAPGIEASVAGLSKRASQLFQVPLKSPGRALGKNTLESIQAGIIYGAVGQIDELVKRISGEIGEPIKKVVATGGLSDMVFGISSTIQEVVPALTLDGLKLIYNRLNK
ncbi:MAG: type III pantothenate kinase [candidate division Zixibacteria bacterium]|nr:type III pantothenate kinase [candidate division Zixibacteria bacterium]